MKPGRLDKVAILGLKAEDMQVFWPGLIKIPRPGEPPIVGSGIPSPLTR